MKKIKALALLLAVVMVIGLFAGCGGNKTPTTTAGNNTPETKGADETKGTESAYDYGTVHGVKFSVGWCADPANDKAVANQKDLEDRYEAASGNDVEFMTWSYDYQSFAAQAEGGQLPTVFTVANTEPEKLFRNGWYRDVKAQLDAVGWTEDKFLPALRDMVTSDKGEVAGYCYQTYGSGLFINKAIATEAGLVNADGTVMVPETWDQLKEYCQIVKDKTGKGGMAIVASNNEGGWNFCNIAWSYGADLIVEKDGKYAANLNSPEAIAAMEWYKTMFDAGLIFGDPVVDSRQNMLEFMAANQVYCTWGGADQALQITSNLADGGNRDDLALIPVPKGPKDWTSVSGGACYWFNPSATDEEVMAALEYLKFGGGSNPDYSEEMQAQWDKNAKACMEDQNAVYLQNIPAYTGDLADHVFATIKNWMGDLYANYETYYDACLSTGTNYLHVEEEYECQNMYAELTKVVQEIANNRDADVSALMNTAQTNLQSIIDATYAG